MTSRRLGAASITNGAMAVSDKLRLPGSFQAFFGNFLGGGKSKQKKEELQQLRREVRKQQKEIEQHQKEIEQHQKRHFELDRREQEILAPRNGALEGHVPHLDDIEAFLQRHHTPLNAPLILISQVQRSGGTLLSDLLDSHPAIASHPNEFTFADQTHESWPALAPQLGADGNFSLLFQNRPKVIKEGYTKGDQSEQRHPFFLLPQLQLHLFQHLFETTPPSSPRQVLDLYFTSLFNAWLNRQGSLQGKQWIAAFAPRLANDEANVASFFETYSDGRLIQIIRDPHTWYPSAREHRRSKKLGLGPEQILDVWCTSVEAIGRNKARYGDRVTVLKFDDLVARTEPTMRDLAERLGISFKPTLLQPTFNGRPIRANSSFPVDTSGVITAPLTRKASLSKEEHELIERRCRALYEETLLTLGSRQSPPGVL